MAGQNKNEKKTIRSHFQRKQIQFIAISFIIIVSFFVYYMGPLHYECIFIIFSSILRLFGKWNPIKSRKNLYTQQFQLFLSLFFFPLGVYLLNVYIDEMMAATETESQFNESHFCSILQIHL